MKTHNSTRKLFFCLRAGLLLCAATAVPGARAATLWTGPNITFTQSGGNGDTILTGKVVLSRGINDGLYNTAAGESYPPGASSPADTLWAFGSLANFSTLTYQSFESLRNGNLAGRILNQPMVVHLVNEDIYLSIKFSAWGQHFAGGFSYTRSTAPPPTPTVSISTPLGGSLFAAPASVGLTASASVSSGTVTNVSYFAGTTFLGRASTSPFGVTGSIASPGPYALTAVATAGGISATSAAVNITVVARPTVSIASPADGTVLSAPAIIHLSANASESGGTVTNVAYFNHSTALGSSQTTPFNLTTASLGAGSYSLSAVATAFGITATSAVVNVSVVLPVDVSLGSSSSSGGFFSMSYHVDPGLRYVVQGSSNLLDWVSLVTNVPTSDPATFSQSETDSPATYFRVGRLPNP